MTAAPHEDVAPRAVEQRGAQAPRFSVIMPAYNSARTLEDAVRSVLAQTLADFELCIVDDGSTDDTLAIARRLEAGDARVRVAEQPNAGAAAARNAAAAMARGRYLALLDADDLYLPHYLERMAALADASPDAALLSCAGRYRFPGGREMRLPRESRPRAVCSYTLGDLIERNRVLVTAVVSAEAFADVGGFRNVYVEDYDLWLRLLAAGYVHRYTPEELVIYRVGSGKSSQRAEAALSAIAVLEELARSVGLSTMDESRRQASIERLRHAVEIGRIEERLAAGDRRGARWAYLRHAAGAPTLISRAAGTLSMLIGPRAYVSVMMRGRTHGEEG